MMKLHKNALPLVLFLFRFQNPTVDFFRKSGIGFASGESCSYGKR